MTGVTQFFAERCEVDSLVTEVHKQELGFLYAVRDARLEPLNIPPDSAVRHVFIGRAPLDEEGVQGGADAPAKWGLVLLDLPLLREDVLTMTVLSSRNDWTEDDGRRGHLATAGRLHKKIKSFLREYLELKFPIWAGNRQTRRWERYKDIGYTKGVASFTEGGGHLKQEGVANVEFFLAPPNYQDPGAS